MSIFDSIAGDLLAAASTLPKANDRFIINDRGGGVKWPFGLSKDGSSFSINHTSARRNSRSAMQDNPLARAMVERMADATADIGLRLELTPVAEILGITREEADAWAQDVSMRFHLWASDKRQHRSETLTFYQYQRFYAFAQQRDNDMFTRLYYSQDPSLQNPLQFESNDPDQIRSDAYTYSNGYQNSVDGIIRDERNRESAYKVWVKKQDGTYEERTINAVGPKSGRMFMLHGFRQEYSGQGRGFTRLAHAIQEFENLTDFSASIIKKAINQSSIVAFVEPSKDEDANNPLADILTNAGAGPAAEMFGTNAITPESGSTETERIGVASSYQLPEATIDTPGSMLIANLTKGSTIKFPQNTAPGDSFDKFVDAFASYLSASTGTPLEVVLMKFNNNYSASRATLLLFFRIACGWRFEMDSDLLSPIVEMWLSGEIAAGRVIAPGWSDPRMKAAWLHKNWIGQGAPDIDPVKTANANKINLEINATNLDRVARDLNGSSAAANIEKNKSLYDGFAIAPWTVKQSSSNDKDADEMKSLLNQISDILDDERVK